MNDGRYISEGKVISKEELTIPSCRQACPIGIDIPRYIRYISQGKLDEAVAVIREKTPLSLVCGYVCHHPCEERCGRVQFDEPIAIRALKRFAVEKASERWEQRVEVAPATGKDIAVVGSGTAGLTAAYYLAKRGHKVTIFDALPEPGGMIRVGIPEYQLPRKVLDREINDIEAVGVSIKRNSRVESLDELFKQGYNAIFLATGTHQDLKLGVEGEDRPGVIGALSFLRKVNLEKARSSEEANIGNKVIVIGGGNTAIDAARAALRFGTEVHMVCLEPQGEMPAFPWEIEAALDEGVILIPSYGVKRILTEGRVTGVELMECASVFDAKGRFSPSFREDKTMTIEGDTVLVAIGQKAEIPPRFDLSLRERDLIEVEPETLATSKEGVFAGGDAVLGPASLVEAIAHGRQAAISIDRYLGGSGIIDETLIPPEKEVAIPQVEVEKKPRTEMLFLPLEERRRSFAAVELGFTEKTAVEEAKRCLSCDIRQFEVEVDSEACKECRYCEGACNLDVFSLGETFNRKGYRPMEVIDTQNCVGCGLCFYRCPDFCLNIREVTGGVKV